MAMNIRNNALVHGCEFSLVLDQQREPIPERYGPHQDPGHYLIFRVDFLTSNSSITVHKEYTYSSLNLQSITSSREEMLRCMRRWITQMSPRSVPRDVTNSLAQEITSSAIELTNRHHDFATNRILRLYLNIFVDYDAIELDRAMRESESSARVARGTISATKLSVKALEEVNLEEDCCIICLEKLCYGYEKVLLRMPCSHIYHKTCIVQWLESSNLCPVCRYAMPVHDRHIPMSHDHDNDFIRPRRNISRPHELFNSFRGRSNIISMPHELMFNFFAGGV